MRKFSKSKKAAILASIMGGWMIGGSAFAANLLITVPSNYGDSNMTAITGSRVTDKVDSKANVAVIESLNKDPGTYSFVLDGKSMFLLRQYNSSTVDLIPSKVIGADTTWSKDEVYPSGIITKGANPHSAAGYNGYIYVGDYDLGTIGVVKYDKNVLTEEVSKSRNLMEDLNTYCGMSYSSPGWVHGEGMVVKNGQLYVVVSINPKGGYAPYDDSIIMQYQIKDDGSLEYVNYTCSARNPDSVKLNNYNDILLHTGVGGYQYVGQGNSESAITLATINNNVLNQESKSVVLPENVKSNGLDFRDMTVWPNGTAYILAYNLATSGGGSNLKVYKTTVANLSSDNPVDWEIVVEGNTEGGGNTGVGTGWFNKLFAEYYTKRVWGEFGNNIVVYTDGAAKPTYTWSAYELAGNTSYHTFNSVSLLSGDTVFGNKALLTTSREEGLTSPSVTTTKIVNINANSKTGDYFQRISGTDADSSVYSGVSSDNSVYTFTADKTISLKPNAWKTQADLSNNILAAVYAHDGNDVTVNAGSNTLQLQVQNSVATPVGVYAGNGKSVTINAGKLNIITIGAVNGNSLNNAIMNDAGKSAASKITVNGDVNISMNGSYGGNGVAVQKTDRWGEASYASDVANTITINGNLTIKGSDSETWGIPINADNVLSRFNNAGILAQVENSRVDVSGTADMDVYGNGITTNAKNSTVSIGGGEINVPKGMNYGYYTLGAYQGTINVNTGKDGTAAGNNSVKLGGDIFALKTGTVNVALTTDDSYLRGIVDNGGTVNMWLQNGASWINQANNTRYAQDNEDVGSNGASHISKLTGGSAGAAGVIFQKSGSKNITIDKYSGNTMVIYEHDNSNPENILGGNFAVKTAETGSAVALRTDSSGVNTSSEATVNKVLDALANKLYYTDYVNGSRNLDGQVQIAEGLTAASAAKYVSSVKYSDTTGQGSLGEKISVQTETPEGDNTDADRNFLVEKGDWHGNNSGDNVNLALKDKASWTGNNSGSNMVVNATDSAWTGDNKGTGINATLNASDWNGKNDGSKAVVTLKNKASWTGDSSGSDLQLTLDDSDYNGNISGESSSVTLNNGSSWEGNSSGRDVAVNINNGSSWSGNVIGSGSTLNMHGDSLWKLKGDNVLDSFNAGSISKMRKAAAVAAGGGTTVDMTDATAGNLTINKYNGKATFVYQHDVNDVTKINGGDITIGTATTGSGITLLTDSNGLETTNKYAINDALNALANKLYYTGYLNGEKNLDGYVKIAEGLTSASATKFAGNIGYDSKTGQGSLDKETVDYGTSIPNVQSKTDFKTTVTGDYVTDKEYRDAGVLPDTDNIYNFTKDATTITTAGSAVTTAKDTTLKLNNNDLTITANSGDGIATTGGTLTVQDAGNFAVTGAKAINANNSKVDITAVNATLNGDVSTNNVVNIKATKAAKVNGAVSANGVNSSVSINGGEATTVTGAVNADGANAAVTIDSADTTIGSDVTANGKGAKVTAKNIGKLDGDVATDADGSVELNFKEGASWTGDNAGNTTMSLSKGSWNGANTGKLNATLTNGTSWTGDSSGAGSTIKLDGSAWSGANSGVNADITLNNGASWSKGNTADGVTVKADKAAWTGANGGANTNITLTNATTWTGANNGANATVSLTDSNWSGDNSGAGLNLTADNSKWNGSTSAAGSATLTNGSIWNGASTSADFSLTLNGSTWNNSGASSLKSFNATNGIVDMTNAAASVTIGSYSGDATVIYKHNSSNPGEVYGGNFTVTKAAANSKITMLTDNTGVDTTDEDKINEALDALAGKLFYTGAVGGAENNLNGTVKIAEGLTATSVAKQTAGIVYDKTTGQGSADHKTVTPGPVYPTEQDRTAFVTSITGEHLTDKEYRKAGVLSNTVDNNIYNFTKDATTITTDSSAVTTAKDTTLKLNNHDLTITANSGDGIATTGGTLTVQDAGSLTVNGAKAINGNNSKVDITAVNATLNGDVATNNTVTIKAAKAVKVNGAVSVNGANAAVTIDSADTTIGSGITANGKSAKVTAKNLSKLNGNVATDADGSVELNFKEGASWSGDNSGNTTMSLSKGTWNGANTGKLNATLTNGTTWTGDSSGAGSIIKLDGSAWSGANSGANADITLNNGASWSKGNTADGVTVKADKATWTGANSGANTNITLTNATTWTGANNGANATVSLTDSSWSGDNSGAGLNLTADNSKWNGGTSAAGSATLTNGSIWNGASTSADFSLTLNGSTWNNSGASSLKSFNATNGIVDMTNAAASVTIGSYSGDATVIYKHNSSNPGEVYGGNFTVTKAAANSKITMLTDNTGVDTTDEDKINEALDALAGKLFYTGAVGGAENNLNGTVKIAEGLTATSVAKQTAGIVYDKTTGQGSADHKTVTPGPVYPTEQDRTAFVTSITGEHLTDKEYRKAGVLSNTVDNNIYNFTKDATTITTDSSAITTAKDTTLKLNNHDLTITANSGDGIATTGATLTVQNAGSLTVSGAQAINANNSKVDITAVNATLNGDVSTNNVVNIKATKAAKVNGAVSANGANAAVTIDSADTTIGSDITANGNGAKVTAKNLSKLNGDVATDADGSVELNFKEGAAWSGDNAGNTTMSLSKGSWNGANIGKLNATLTNGTSWTGDSSGVGSTIKLDGSAWNGANTGSNATISLTDSNWTGDNSGAGLSLTADNSKWNGSTSAAGSAVLTNGSVWTGASTSADFALTLNGSTWNNSGASSLKSFTGTNGVVDMTNAAAGVTIGSYSGDATVIYKHNSSNPGEVYGGNFTVTKAAANSKITMLTDNTGVDTTDEDKINEALDALAGKLFYTGAVGGAENNLNGTVKIAEGLTATSVAKQTAGIVYDKTTGQGSADHKTVTPGPVYPTEQDRTAFVTSITGEHLTDKEYRKAGVLSNTVDNNIYNFTKDATTITTDSSAITTAKDTTLKLNNHDLTITANSGDGIATTGATLTVQNAGSLTVSGAQAINANNSKVDITAVNATLNGDVSTNNVVNIKATKAAKVNGAVSANGANAAVTIDSADTTIGSDITANGNGAKVTAKNLSKLNGDVATDADGSVELNFKEGASWTGDNSGNTTMSLSKGTWNGANTGKLNATLTNGTTWTGDSSGAGSTIKLDGSAWNGANSGVNADITLTNGASWTKGNTADGVTVKADKSSWTGANGGAKANITLSNSASWTGANTGSNATVNLTDSSWTGANSGVGLSLTANNSKWNGSTSTAGSATLTNGSIWNGASTSAGFALTLNGSTWNNSGASSLKSFIGTNGIVDMTNAAASVTIGSYSGDATVIYKHNSSNPAEVYGGNFTVNNAKNGSKITMLTDNTGVDTTDEDKINEALNALAGKLFYTGAIGGAENNLNGTVKIAEGLTATSVAKQTAGIVYDKTTGQGSADHKTVTPGPVYPTEQDRTAFVTSITGEHLTDKEYRKAGVLSNTVDNNIYNFTKDATTITTAGSAVNTAKDATLKLNSHDMTITANSGDGIATNGGKLTVQNAGSLTVKGAKAINANNSKVDITAVNATLNGDVTTNNTVTIKVAKAAKVNGAVSASGANSSVSINGTASAAISGAVSADGANAAVTIDSADTIIGSDITANGKGAKVTAKNLSKLDGNVATDADGSVELNFKEGASWTGDNAGNTTMSLSKGSWNGANTGKLNATLTNGTTWTGDSSGAGSTIKLDASSWSGMNSGANANVTLTNGASWTKGNTADGVTVKADKAAWTGANGGANANITLGNASTWTGANSGSKATVNMTDSSWSGDNSGANVTITANNSKWNGSTSAAGSATLTNGSIWNGASTSADFSLTLNGSTWNNSGASSLKSFNATNGIVDMTNAAAGVTIGSYSGDATVIYKHNSSNPAEVYGGNFTVNKAAANSKITMLTDNTGVDTTDEDKINEALDALAGKLFYLGAIGGAESNLNGTVKIAEGLTATSVAKQTAGIVYDKTTGQGSADHKTVTPGPVYPTEQDRTAFVTSITGEHFADKEYRKAGVLSNTVDNNIYNFTKDATTITTAGSAVTTAKDTTLKLNNNDMTITANSGDGIAITGGKLTVQDAGSLTVSGAKAINANNSKVEITAVNATLNGDVSTNNVVNIKATKAAKVNGAVSANGANAAVTIDSADTTIGSDITANGKGAKVIAKNLSKLDGDVATDADGSVELNFKEGASWSGDNSGNTTMSLSKGSWNGANTGKLNAKLTNGTSWTGDSSGAGSTIKLDASTWNGANSGANANVTLTNGASWSKGNTADGVTVKADKAAWTGANGGANANITLGNASTWTGANSGSKATVNMTDSSWSGDNSGANVTITANNSKWNGSTSAAGSATLTNGSIWTGASTSGDFSLTLNNSTWNNSGASSLKSFTGTNGIVDMTNAAASVTIGSYSGDATVIYKHNSSNPAEVYGGNFTVNKAAANSKITMLTDRSGVDFSDEVSIANALNSLANKLYYTGYITGERNLTGYVKLAEGLTASSVVKQTGDIAYDKTTGQGSLKDGSVTPNVTYPEEQTKDNFTSQITGEWKQDKEYKLAGVLHTDNAVYDFSKDRSIITTAGTSIGAGKDLQLLLNNKSMSLNSGADAVKADAITIEFKNLDKLDIKAAGQALLAENGGKIILHNTGAVTADSAFVANGAGSGIKADGLTNITVGSGDAVKADAGSIELAGGTVKGDVTADNKGKISINANNNAAGSILTDITGNVLATAGSSVDIGLGTADSKLTGDVSTAGDAVINIYADMGIWTGNADGDNVNLHLNSSKAQWNNIGNSKLRSLKGNGGIINQTDANAGNIDVGDYSGNVVVNYKHTADKDTASNTLNNIKFGGGSLNIDKAAEGSSITLRTDNSDNLSYTETDNIEKLFRELSKKLYYADAGSNPDNLSGHVEIAEGLTKVKVYGDINYGEHGQGNYKDGSIKRTDPEIIYGSSETAMMCGAKSAMASTALLWRSENSDMLQRMGDVRLDNEESGLWARYYGGKNSFDAKNTKYSTSFNAYQLGYDKQLDNNKLFGAAVSYNKGKNTYEMGGHGDGKAVSLSVYGSWNSDKGHYADVIVKGGKLDNDYTVYNDMGHKLEGDYDTWGLSLSAEYGRRMQMQNGFYIDPSVQFTVGRVAGADYSAASDFLDSKGLKKDMYVSQDAFTSAIGRIGLGMGKTTDKAMFYTKFALAHEFSGDFTTTFAAENEPTSSTAVDFGGTWFEWQLGGSMKVNDNSYVYATFEKKFGGDTGSNDWRLDAGLRWSF
ncbi:hypothetical protein KAH19_08315 [Phascolarctobacterium sp. Marseille-Q4147]|uniref:autotransporter outer membrane beta-barrel domain-containing protein n=1 Tax=Phascolarctobacterium sp. Marseille-Q4147 TaxID=2823317 RepID=UPI001B33A6E4|nr:autotransporter outer membrane beta-barrel domain-containing protein [Phascolarctobacterium sp. Marseille-Q4147]QTV77315.1 hypothetical protein KAH19_08315 [Phascolarctobacterium sp. Marseille-Q4147]